VVFQIGVSPVPIDVLTAIDAVSFDEAWHDRVTTAFDDEPVTLRQRTGSWAPSVAAPRTAPGLSDQPP
jgi:hypothetical protein